MFTVNWLVFGDLITKSCTSFDEARELSRALLVLGVSYVVIENR